ncbi:MAG: hypothetical protein HYU52_16655 [Acidobacteria bacterium]|nr:hypothetical protein [Acidobacteriota bacterium]
MFAGTSVLLPVVGRSAGANGSFWKTDVFITNVWRTGPPVPVTIKLLRSGLPAKAHSFEVSPLETVAMEDLILKTFGEETASGALLVSSDQNGARFSARARIFNSGNSMGEFAQSAQAVSVSRLPVESVLAGLDGTRGKRVNLGLANPRSSDAEAVVRLFRADGELVRTQSVSVPAERMIQINDIFMWFNVEAFAGATLVIGGRLEFLTHPGQFEPAPISVYASEILSGSGDPIFIAAVGDDPMVQDPELAPPCETPAEYDQHEDPVGDVFVGVREGNDVTLVAYDLAGKYHFLPSSIFTPDSFVASLPPETIAAIRCDPRVDHVTENGWAYPLTTVQALRLKAAGAEKP